MINITRLSSGAILLQRDDAEIIIDAGAVPQTLGPILAELIGQSKALSTARRDAYESGLIVGYQNGAREAREQLEKEAERIAEGLALLKVNAPMAA